MKSGNDLQFESECRLVGNVELPTDADTRILLMPFMIGDPIPEPYEAWHDTVYIMLGEWANKNDGEVGYLSIDCSECGQGESHRRPRLHVDGWKGAAWGGPSGLWGRRGMLMATDVYGCDAWNQDFSGEPAEEGDCEHLRDQLQESARVEMKAGEVWWCTGMCVHEAIPQPKSIFRRWVRVSLPSHGGWYSTCTPSPVGVMPTGPILTGRDEFLAYRA